MKSLFLVKKKLTVGWVMPIDEFLFFGKISVYSILFEGVGAIKTKILPISSRQTWWWWEISSWGLGELARPAFYYMVWPLQHPAAGATTPYRLPSKNLWSELWCAISIWSIVWNGFPAEIK